MRRSWPTAGYCVKKIGRSKFIRHEVRNAGSALREQNGRSIVLGEICHLKLICSKYFRFVLSMSVHVRSMGNGNGKR